MNKRGLAPLMLVLLALGAFILFVGADQLGSLSLASITGSNDFAKPLWARLECAPTDSFEGVSNINLASQRVVVCGSGENTEECRMSVSRNDPRNPLIAPITIAIYYKKCDVNGNNCGSYSTVSLSRISTQTLPVLHNGESYFFASRATGADFSGSNSGTLTVIKEWMPWKLYRYVGGARYIVNSADCRITAGRLGNILQTDFTTDTLSRQGGEGQKWINYVDDWAYGPGTNVFNYQGQQVYCSGARVYSIVQLRVANGNLVKIDPSYRGSQSDGTPINGLGSLIASVECCPNEPNCGSDFRYRQQGTPGTGPAQCVSDLQCYNAGGPVPNGPYTYVTYSCNAGTCQASAPITVECTTNAQCASGQICDLSTTNYGQCITQNPGAYCGDNICQTTENHETCSADCDFSCPPGQFLITNTQTTGALCFFGVGLCDEQTTRYCSDSPPGTDFSSLGTVLIIIAILVGLYFLWPYIRAILKAIPGVRSIVP